MKLLSFCCSLLLLCVTSSGLYARQVKEGPSYIQVSGEVTTPLKLTAADLGKLKRVNTTLTDRDGKVHEYSGVPLMDVLNLAGITSGAALRGENLAKYLLVKCADGYEVVFSLAELDASFTDRVVVLADQVDGGALPAGKGPYRLVVPGEKKPARSCHQVVEFVVKFAKE